MVVDSLNHLAAARVNSAGPEAPSSGSLRDTAVQTWMLESISRRVALFGEPAADLEPELALREICFVKDLYSQEPKHLATYDLSKLKVAGGSVRPRPAVQMLPPLARGLLENHEHYIAKNHAEVEQMDVSEVPGQPSWDPTLRRSRKARMELLGVLVRAGVVSFRRAIRARVSFFFVKKKSGMIRLIVDARQANAYHRRPPVTRLASAGCYTELDLSDGRLESAGFGGLLEFSGHGQEGDVSDCFYNYEVDEVADWFGVDMEPLTVSDWRQAGVEVPRIWENGLFCDPPDDEPLFAVVRVMAMGWSWALFFANEAVAFSVEKSKGAAAGLDSQLRERKEAPVLRPGVPITGTYVDNVTILGGTRQDAAQGAEAFQRQVELEKLPLLWTQDQPEQVLESVGVVLDLAGRRVYNKPARVWRTILAGVALTRRARIRGEHLEIWVGHMISLLQLTRCAQAVFSAVYRFIAVARGRRMDVWPSVYQEIRVASALALLTVADLSAPFAKEVTIGDSSGFGYALLSTRATPAEIRRVWAHRERWRFREQLAEGKHTLTGSEIESLGGLSPLGGAEAASSAEPCCAPSGVILPGGPAGTGASTVFGRWLADRAAADHSSHRVRPPILRRRRPEVEMPQATTGCYTYTAIGATI